MQFEKIRLINFRNFATVEAGFSGQADFICGRNGQGKTNLLEALGFVTSLRSFRTVDARSLIRWDTPAREAGLFFVVQHEERGPTTLEIHLQPGAKRVLLDGEPVRRMRDIIGLFPTVTFSSHDIQILRGGPALRRRFMDMLFVAMDVEYYSTLTRYHQALKARNALLKSGQPGPASRPFDEALIDSGWKLSQLRRSLAECYQPLVVDAYETIARTSEQPEVLYDASIAAVERDAYEEQFRNAARRDLERRTTGKGPHRDDLDIRLFGRDAREFASEGQQRGLVLAMRLALVEWYRSNSKIAPVILADDIVGELDASRRHGFWQAIGPSSQVIATGTERPTQDNPRQWRYWEMKSGLLSQAEGQGEE
jgi:DNA replication and repair protein RecF